MSLSWKLPSNESGDLPGPSRWRCILFRAVVIADSDLDVADHLVRQPLCDSSLP